eukprot:jgi/Chrzof1/2485/Cz11g17100.t1
MSTSQRLVALLLNEDAERWKGCYELLWQAVLGEDGDQWDVYKCCEGQFPAVHDVHKYAFLLLTGSHYSAYEELPWIRTLTHLLPAYAETGVKIVGCCFGSQVLAQAFGGRVAPNPSGRFALTIENVRPTAALANFRDMQHVLEKGVAASVESTGDTQAAHDVAVSVQTSGSDMLQTSPANTHDHNQEQLQSAVGPIHDTQQNQEATQQQQQQQQQNDVSTKGELDIHTSHQQTLQRVQQPAQQTTLRSSNSSICLRLMESHGDQVHELPAGAIPLATSATAAYELWVLLPNILAFQFHLEFNCQVVLDKIWSVLTANSRLSADESAVSKAIMEAGGEDTQVMLQLVRFFIHIGVGSQVTNTPSMLSSGKLDIQVQQLAADKHYDQASAGASAGSADHDATQDTALAGDDSASIPDAKITNSAADSGKHNSYSSTESNPRSQAGGTAQPPASSTAVMAGVAVASSDHMQHAVAALDIAEPTELQHGAKAPLQTAPASSPSGLDVAEKASSSTQQGTSQPTVAELATASSTAPSGTSEPSGTPPDGDHAAAATASATASATAGASNTTAASVLTAGAASMLSAFSNLQVTSQLSAISTVLRDSMSAINMPMLPARATASTATAETHSSPRGLQATVIQPGISGVAAIQQQQQQQQPAGSSCSSPTAASERSSMTGTSSAAVPFAFLAQQRQRDDRETVLTQLTRQLVHDTSAAFDARMAAYAVDYEMLEKMNAMAAGEYGHAADIASALAQFSSDMVERQGAVQDALEVLPQLDQQMTQLEAAVAQLDGASKALETKLGLGASGSSSSGYSTLAGRFRIIG